MNKSKKILLIQYEKKVLNKNITLDQKQILIIEKFQLIYDQITKKYTIKNIVNNLFIFRKKIEKYGIYLWGDVGGGKTFLMNLFYKTLPLSIKKKRIHFHALMLEIHTGLKKLQFHKNPLNEFTKRFINNIKILCIDELYIEDIADAMLMKTFFFEIFKKKIPLIITSNIPPQELYKNGLQRQHFLETIEQLNYYTYNLNLNNQIDYRKINKKKKTIYFFPITHKTINQCLKTYIKYSNNHIKTTNCYLKINNRPIKVKYLSKNTIWITFKDLCCTYRNKEDYIILAKNFTTIVIYGIPSLKKYQNDHSIERFIILIDELYEKKTKLFILTNKPIQKLLTTINITTKYKRLLSRITEMNTIKYLNLTHKKN